MRIYQHSDTNILTSRVRGKDWIRGLALCSDGVHYGDKYDKKHVVFADIRNSDWGSLPNSYWYYFDTGDRFLALI